MAAGTGGWPSGWAPDSGGLLTGLGCLWSLAKGNVVFCAKLRLGPSPSFKTAFKRSNNSKQRARGIPLSFEDGFTYVGCSVWASWEPGQQVGPGAFVRFLRLLMMEATPRHRLVRFRLAPGLLGLLAR